MNKWDGQEEMEALGGRQVQHERVKQSALAWSFQAEIQYRLSSSSNRWVV